MNEEKKKGVKMKKAIINQQQRSFVPNILTVQRQQLKASNFEL
jgi:hypothetical protein